MEEYKIKVVSPITFEKIKDMLSSIEFKAETALGLNEKSTKEKQEMKTPMFANAKVGDILMDSIRGICVLWEKNDLVITIKYPGGDTVDFWTDGSAVMGQIQIIFYALDYKPPTCSIPEDSCDFENDEVIIVTNDKCLPWVTAHFSRITHELGVMCYADGRSRKTSRAHLEVHWKFAQKLNE